MDNTWPLVDVEALRYELEIQVQRKRTELSLKGIEVDVADVMEAFKDAVDAIISE